MSPTFVSVESTNSNFLRNNSVQNICRASAAIKNPNLLEMEKEKENENLRSAQQQQQQLQ